MIRVVVELIAEESINVSQFLRQYDSESTKKSYKTGLKFFFREIYPELKGEDLDVLSERYLAEDRNHREDVMDFKDSLKDKAPKTISNRLNSIRVFLDENGVSFPKRFFKNLNGKVNEAISVEKVPSNEELRRIIEYLPVHGKALALCLSSSGMRIGEAVQIGISDIELNRDPVRIKIRAEFTKTGKRRITFISPEAKQAVEEWLNYRDQYVKIADRRSWKHKRLKFNNVFPFSANNFNYVWNSALTKAKLSSIDSRTKRVSIRPHNLRKFFRLRVGRYGRDEAEALMGHQAGLNRIYANFDGAEERLAEVYKKSLSDLSIYNREVQVVQLDEEMKNKIRELEDQMDALIKSGHVKEAMNEAKITYLSVNDEKKTREIAQLKQKMKKKTEEDEELKRRIANIELDHQSLNTLKPYLEEIFNSTGLTWKFQDITSKNRKVTGELKSKREK